jgi:hypothetical protein
MLFIIITNKKIVVNMVLIKSSKYFVCYERGNTGDGFACVSPCVFVLLYYDKFSISFLGYFSLRIQIISSKPNLLKEIYDESNRNC